MRIERRSTKGRGFQRGPNGPWYCSAATSFAINATRTAEFLTPTTTPLQMPQMKSPGARVITSSVLIGLLLVFAIFIALWRILSARRVSARESEKVHHDQKVEAPLLASDQAPNVSVAQIPAHVKNSKGSLLLHINRDPCAKSTRSGAIRQAL
jgi:hypothetical protein